MATLNATAVNATINSLLERITTLEAAVKQDTLNLDIGWTLQNTFLIFFMQTGFAMLEAGGVRLVNVVNILLKNIIDTAIGCGVYYLFGFAFNFGDPADGSYGNGFIGTRYFALENLGSSPPYSFQHFIFQWAFCGTASTIVSGAMAERTRLRAYLFFSVIMTTWIYPVASHWVWSKSGWLSPFKRNLSEVLFANGFLDYAGDSVVHMIGGVSALIGAIAVGPRLGRFDKDLSEHFQPHNLSFMTLGTMILWFGWYGFNAGSTQALNGANAFLAGKIAVNTTLAAGFGTLTGLILAKIFLKSWNLPCALNGCLTGLVTVTGGCGFIEPWAAVIAGITGAIVYFLAAKLLIRFQIDDPLEASCVHFFGGLWGLIFVGLFATPWGLEVAYGRPTQYGGLFINGNVMQLLMQLLGAVVITAWTAFWSGIMWFVLKKAGVLRIAEAAEKELLSNALELQGITRGGNPEKSDSKSSRTRGNGKASRHTTDVKHMRHRSKEKKKPETVVVIDESSSDDSNDDD